jgi:hypothetical protein
MPPINKDVNNSGELSQEEAFKSLAGDARESVGELMWGAKELDALEGPKKYETLYEMKEIDATIGAMLFAAKMIIRSTDWTIKAQTDEDEEFLESVLEDMSYSFNQQISSILDFLPYGFNVHEIVYKRRNGDTDDPRHKSKFDDERIGWRDFPRVAHDSIKWHFHPEVTGHIIGVSQQNAGFSSNNFIPREKMMHFRTSIHSPEGRSILKSAYRSWVLKKNKEDIESVGIERDLSGFPVFKVPTPVITSDDDPWGKIRKKMQEQLAALRRDENEGMLFPQEFNSEGEKIYDIELLSPGTTRQIDIDQSIQRDQFNILMTTMSEFIALGVAKRGSFSLADAKMEMFEKSLTGYLDIIKDQFNNRALPRLWKLNGWNKEDAPEIQHGGVKSTNISDIAELLIAMAESGETLFPNKELSSKLLDMIGIKEDPGFNIQQSDEPAEEPYQPGANNGMPEDGDQLRRLIRNVVKREKRRSGIGRSRTAGSVQNTGDANG